MLSPLPHVATDGEPAPVIAPARTFADSVRFRDAMARLASGVAIVACLDRGQPRGLLVSSLTSLSLEPPRMLFCVRKAAGSHDALRQAHRCSLSILSDQDAEEAERFSAPGRATERFAADDGRLGAGSPPVYARALVGLTGLISGGADAGSHSVFFLDIETVEARDATPLVYFDRAFRTLDPAHSPGRP